MSPNGKSDVFLARTIAHRVNAKDATKYIAVGSKPRRNGSSYIIFNK